MSRLPALGPRGEGWVVIQFVLLGLVVAGAASPGRPDDGADRHGCAAWPGSRSCRRPRPRRPRPPGPARRPDAAPPPARRRASSSTPARYGLVRHPIYGGLVHRGGRLGAGRPRRRSRSPAPRVLLGFFRLKSGREEAWLRERYPAYEAYAGRHEADDPLGLLTPQPARSRRASSLSRRSIASRNGSVTSRGQRRRARSPSARRRNGPGARVRRRSAMSSSRRWSGSGSR